MCHLIKGEEGLEKGLRLLKGWEMPSPKFISVQHPTVRPSKKWKNGREADPWEQLRGGYRHTEVFRHFNDYFQGNFK